MAEKPQCGLCGKSTPPLTKTECCNNWICDDEYYCSLNPEFESCMRNHTRNTICHNHYVEGHMDTELDWRKCNRCKEMFSTENYVSFVTNEYNFNEPAIKYQMANCVDCNKIINFNKEPHLRIGDNHYCLACMLKPGNASIPAKKAQPKPKKRQSSAPRSKSTGVKQAKRKTDPKKKTTSTPRTKAKSQSKPRTKKTGSLPISGRRTASTPRAKAKSKSKPKKQKPKAIWTWAPSYMIKQRRKKPAKKTWLLPASGSRTASTPRAQSKSKPKTTKPKRKSLWMWLPNDMFTKSASRSRDSSKSKKYGKRKASPSPKPKTQTKKVKKNNQLNQSGRSIQLTTQDQTKNSSRIEIEKSPRGRSNGKKGQDSHERSSSSSGRTNTKKKVQWIKRP